jgi:hypothetical protein
MLLGAVALLVGWYLFRPELLFINQRVNETLPSMAMTSGQTSPKKLGRGTFKSLAHETKGTATIYELDGGKRTLRLTEFETSNGPDVHVYLVAAPMANDNDTVKQAGFIDLGSMKGNIGDQNYDIPAGTDLAKYQSVAIWCARFNVNFGSSALSTAMTN